MDRLHAGDYGPAIRGLVAGLLMLALGKLIQTIGEAQDDVSAP
jgi:hypothetical protein